MQKLHLWRAVMAEIAHHSLINSQASAVPHRVFATLGLWRRRIRERRQLARLSEHDLHDIGVSRGMLYNELRKPFWRA
jgi:uncharacterized protein YjiS (DUF1127 family)